jgi:flagellar basal-body rod protein FlgG
LELNAQSVLTTSEGYPVLGTSGRAITLGAGKIHIGESGDVFLDGTQVDRLKVTSFTDLTALEKEGSSLFKTTGGQNSEKASEGKIKSGFLEQSNVNPVFAITRMVEINRNFEAIQKSIHLMMNDMNAKAIDKLGR